MKTIKIELDFLIGPIVKDIFDISKNKIVTGVPIIDNDEELEKLNSEISDLYNSFYEFDTDDKPCIFNERKFIEKKSELISLLTKLNKRLDEINDGTFVIENNTTSLFLPNIDK